MSGTWLLLALGMAVAVASIVWLRLNAFVGLMAAAFVVSGLAPGGDADFMRGVGQALGETTGKIGPVIVLAAIIGRAMTQSGAAKVLAAAIVRGLGERRQSLALLGSGYVLSIPVFFDTVFYLLLPIARSQAERRPRTYGVALLAIVAGAGITHTLVPPTPGPLAMAASLGVDLGAAMLVGLSVSLLTASLLIPLLPWLARPLQDLQQSPLATEPLAAPSQRLPSLVAATLPVVVPVVLIGAGTVRAALGVGSAPGPMSLLADPTVALAVAAGLALTTAARSCGLGVREVGRLTEHGLRDAAPIVLITAAGSAFGASLKLAGVGDAAQSLVGADATGYGMLLVGFGLAALLKVAQGSSTAAMVVTSSILSANWEASQALYHPAYLCMAVGSGSLVGSWMNDSGFWIFSTMGGVSERKTLATWTVLMAVLGAIAFAITLTLAWLLPLR